jgi:hypothetical protein
MPVKYGVLAVAVAGAAASLGFIGSLEEGMQLRDLVTKDSFFHRFQTTMERTYGSYMGPPSSLYFHQLNHSDPDAQLRMLSARHYLLTSSQYVSAEFTSSTHWLSALLALDTSLLQPCALLVSDATLCNTPYAPEQLLPAEHFYPLLRQMLQANTLNVAKQLSLDADGAVVASEFQYIHRDVSVSDTGRVFDEAQAIQKHINTQLLNKKHDASPVDAQQEEAVLYSEYLLFGQSNTVLWKETVQNLSLVRARAPSPLDGVCVRMRSQPKRWKAAHCSELQYECNATRGSCSATLTSSNPSCAAGGDMYEPDRRRRAS